MENRWSARGVSAITENLDKKYRVDVMIDDGNLLRGYARAVFNDRITLLISIDGPMREVNPVSIEIPDGVR